MKQQAVTRACIEAACATGPVAVRAMVETLEKGLSTDCLPALSERERALIIDELKAALTVYERRSA